MFLEVPSSESKAWKKFRSAHLIAQKQKGVAERERAVRRMKQSTIVERVQRGLPDDGVVRWNATVTCETCKAEWQMAKQLSKTTLVKRLADQFFTLGQSVEYLTKHGETTCQGPISLVYEREEFGQVTDS